MLHHHISLKLYTIIYNINVFDLFNVHSPYRNLASLFAFVTFLHLLCILHCNVYHLILDLHTQRCTETKFYQHGCLKIKNLEILI